MTVAVGISAQRGLQGAGLAEVATSKTALESVLMMPVNEIFCGDWIDVAETLPSGIAHCIITSPAYWRQRRYGWGGDGSCEEKKAPHVWQINEPIQTCLNCGMMAPTLGLEKTPEEHIEKLVVGFRELRRVLRDDGVVFLNYGDKYNGGNNKSYGKDEKMIQKFSSRGSGKVFDFGRQGKNSTVSKVNRGRAAAANLKQGDLIGLAWRLALALQADGWYLRSDIIWAKALSFCDKYSGSTMPESVNGWRWERHKVKVKSAKSKANPKEEVVRGEKGRNTSLNDWQTPENLAQWQDCPGCAKCEPNDGLVLRKGSWRPTRAHEYLFLLAKSPNYFCDMEAVREEASNTGGGACFGSQEDGAKGAGAQSRKYDRPEYTGRNLRDVFCINPQAYPDSHYATFPEKLVEPCIKVGTSEKGCCPKCGAQWARIVDNKSFITRPTTGRDTQKHKQGIESAKGLERVGGHVAVNTTTLGWRPTCKCGIKETVPCIVYDPFMGSGTVAAVAARLGRNYIGSELNEDYVKNQAEYRVAEGETGISKQEQRQGQQALFK